MAETVAAAVAAWPGEPVVVTEDAERYGAFAAADAAVAASGTVALELALAGTPTLIAYRVSALSAWLARRLIKIRYVNLINIVLGREAVPERLQEDCRPDILACEIDRLLDDAQARAAQAAGVAEALRLLGRNDESPSRRAARVVLAAMDARRSPAR